MGELGMSSRICAGQFGSVITFAAGKDASAPGQIDAVTLQGYLEKYYK
jgi:3-dehydroquinate dehydratase-1